MYRESFYHFLMTQRNPNQPDEVEQFANNAFYDSAFPKQSQDFDEISKYLEENAKYLPSMLIFDDAWRRYARFNGWLEAHYKKWLDIVKKQRDNMRFK